MHSFRNPKQIRSIMACKVSPTSDPKRRRIMIITADENIIDEIERSSNELLLQQIIVESAAKNCVSSNRQVGRT